MAHPRIYEVALMRNIGENPFLYGIKGFSGNIIWGAHKGAATINTSHYKGISGGVSCANIRGG